MQRSTSSGSDSRRIYHRPLPFEDLVIRAALSTAFVTTVSAIALGYIRQPRFITDYARGSLFVKIPYRQGLIAGAIAGPVLTIVEAVSASYPILAPILCMWLSAKSLVNGGCFEGRTVQGDLGPLPSQILCRLIGLGVLVGIQGFLMRKRFHPKFMSGFCAFAGGSLVIGQWTEVALVGARKSKRFNN